MDKFYVITNKLKDADYSITNEILDYIEQHGKTGILSQKDPDGHKFHMNEELNESSLPDKSYYRQHSKTYGQNKLKWPPVIFLRQALFPGSIPNNRYRLSLSSLVSSPEKFRKYTSYFPDWLSP